MTGFQGWRTLAAVAACMFALVACGGGGGGSNSGTSSTGSNGGGGSSSQSITFTADRTSLDFGGFANGPVNTEEIHFTVTGSNTTLYIDVETQARSLFEAPAIVVTSGTAFTVRLMASNTAGAEQTGTFQFRICADMDCQNVLATRSIPYTLAVYEFNMPADTTVGFQGSHISGIDIPTTPFATASDFTLDFYPGEQTYSDWLSGSVQDGDLKLSVDADNLPVGQHVGTVDITLTRHPELRSSLLFGFLENSASIATPPVTLTLDNGGSVATTPTPVPVAFESGVSPTWHVTSDQPWLVLTQPSAAGSGTFGARVDAGKVGTFANGSSRIANVTVSADGLDDTTIPVTLMLSMPQVTSISPSAVPTGAPATLHVSGRGFAQPGALAGIAVTGASITSSAVDSDTEATIVVTAMSPGLHTVSIANAYRIHAASAWVGAVTPTLQPYAFVADDSPKWSAFFDATRNAVFAVTGDDYGQTSIVRYQRSAGKWQALRLAVTDVVDIALSRDQATLFARTSQGTLVQVDPATLTIRQTLTRVGFTYDPQAVGDDLPMNATADGRLWLSISGDYYDAVGGVFANDFEVAYSIDYLQNPIFNVTSDGRTMFIAGDSYSYSAGSSYSSSTQQVATSANLPAMVGRMSSSTSGLQRLLGDHAIYDGNWNSVGDVEESDSYYPAASVMSPAGDQAYKLFANASGTGAHVGVFSTTSLVAGTTRLQELGTLPVRDQANCMYTVYSDCDWTSTLMIDATGENLYWLGTMGLVVIPVPANLSGARSAQGPSIQAARKRSASAMAGTTWCH